ncbi:MAG: alpha-amylase [Colwelliaceae bacterium]|nr:alpha-amylase [Colwelliaceae bacterium]
MNKFASFIYLSLSSLLLISCDSGNISKDTNTTEINHSTKDIAHYSKRDIRDDVFYFVLPDRFNNGDKANDLGSKTKKISQGGFNPENKMAFHGGDLIGLANKLPYIEEMGVTAIWLTPILRNQAVQGDITGYHGYWVLDFTEIDPHLGSNEDLKTFIEAAHQRNIKVFFDIITNHTADVVKYKECHGEDGSGWSESGEACPYISLAEIKKGNVYSTIIPEENKQLKTPQWLNDPKHYHNQGDSTFEGENSLNGDFFGLDDLYTESPEVVSGMIDIYKNIISEFRPDGFRIDTVKHVNIEFWQQFIPALDLHAKQLGIDNFFMFGEVYSGDPKELSSFTTEGKLPSVLDFGLQSALYQTLIEDKGTNKLAELFAQDSLYQNANVLLNFTGNHDMGRFAYLLNSKEKQYDENETAARLKLATAITFFARGIPVIYYGDEQGFIGDGGNHDSRQDMMPSKVTSYNDDNLLLSNNSTAENNFNLQHPLFKNFASLAQLYHQHPTLRHGQQKTFYSSESPGIFEIERTLKNDNYLVFFNTSEKNELLKFPSNTEYKLIFSSDDVLNKSLIINNNDLALSGLNFAIYRQITSE